MSNSPEPIDLLIVDDDVFLQQDLKSYFSRKNYRVMTAGSTAEALDILETRVIPVLVVDMLLPDGSGIELLEKLGGQVSDSEVIMLTGQGSIETAVEAMKKGALDYLTKPVRLKELEAVIERAAGVNRLKRQNQQLQGMLRQRTAEEPVLIGASPVMQDVFRLIQRLAPADKPILIQGESGTGKELVARAIHQASRVGDNPLVAYFCAGRSLPETVKKKPKSTPERTPSPSATMAAPLPSSHRGLDRSGSARPSTPFATASSVSPKPTARENGLRCASRQQAAVWNRKHHSVKQQTVQMVACSG